ncbi:MAG: hypothetical protein GY765_07500, partial [bacterium]|nr:hypothetical protein [bacterium]
MNENTFNMDLPLSCKLGELDETIQRLTQKYLQLWWQTDSAAPDYLTSHTPKEQKQIETHLSRLMQNFADYAKQYRTADGTPAADMDFSEPIETTKKYVDTLFQLLGISVDASFVDGVTRTTQTFIEGVNTYDRRMPPENVYQALRNVWIMNTLQTYLK